MLFDHFSLGSHRWPKTAEKRGFCTGVTDGRTDRPSYRDAILTDASKKKAKEHVGESFIPSIQSS